MCHWSTISLKRQSASGSYNDDDTVSLRHCSSVGNSSNYVLKCLRTDKSGQTLFSNWSAAWDLSYPLSAQRRLRSVWAYALADLSSLGAHAILLVLSCRGSIRFLCTSCFLFLRYYFSDTHTATNYRGPSSSLWLCWRCCSSVTNCRRRGLVCLEKEVSFLTFCCSVANYSNVVMERLLLLQRQPHRHIL